MFLPKILDETAVPIKGKSRWRWSDYERLRKGQGTEVLSQAQEAPGNLSWAIIRNTSTTKADQVGSNARHEKATT